jgi:thymidylate synthase
MASVAQSSDSAPGRHWEEQYLELMRRIWNEGDERAERTGIRCCGS